MMQAAHGTHVARHGHQAHSGGGGRGCNDAGRLMAVHGERNNTTDAPAPRTPQANTSMRVVSSISTEAGGGGAPGLWWAREVWRR